MQEARSKLKRASPSQLAAIMSAGTAPIRVWDPGELAAVFRHQLTSPMEVDLGGLEEGLAGKVRKLTDASGLLLKSFADLFAHPHPSVEILTLVKNFAKANRESSESLLPEEVAAMLYYLSIGAGLARSNTRISTLTDEQLRTGFSWALQRQWIDDPTRSLLQAALEALPPEHGSTGSIAEA